MKKILLAALFPLLFVSVQGQSCHGASADTKEDSAPAQFASLADDASFRGMHEEPVSIQLTKGSGKMIKFDVEGGDRGNAYYVPAANEGSELWLFVVHEWWGLNDNTKQEAERLYAGLSELNVNVLAIDLYDGKWTDKREEAGKLMQAVKDERARAIIQGAFAHAGENARVSTIGWCFGGGWSLQTALIGKEQINGCVMYYGMPEKDIDRLEKLNSDVLFVWPNLDRWINEDVKEGFEASMDRVGKNLTVLEYDADHAFANPSSPRYNQEAAQDANAKALEYLKQRFM